MDGEMSKVNFYLTIDIEGDWTIFPNEQRIFNVESIIGNLKLLDEALLQTQDHFSKRIPITWFLRCDASVKSNLGAYNGLLDRLDEFIQKKTGQGDSFGIHPHLYPSLKNRESNTMSNNEIEDQLSEAFSAWQEFFGVKAKYSRIGEARMDNFIAQQLSLKMIDIDSTALPGRARNDSGFCFNWEGTPSKPYHPSKSDYRVYSKTEENYDFIELPFTMLPTKGPDDNEIVNRYFNLSFKHKVIQEALHNYEMPEHIISVLHPHEIVSKKGSKHNIISYQPNSILRNIKNVIQKSKINFKAFDEFSCNG